MKIIVSSKQDARRLGVAVGSLIDESQALPHMIERTRKDRAPLTEAQHKRIEAETAADLAFAKRCRERVANGLLPF